jgi:hypothetical protein
MTKREELVARFMKIDPATAKVIPNLRDHPEIVESREKLHALETELATLKTAIIEGERGRKPTRSAVDVDAEQVLAGETLGPQCSVSDLEQLQRRRAAVERAIVMQTQFLAEVERRIVKEACENVEPIIGRYAQTAVTAFEHLREVLERGQSLFAFLSSRGYARNLRSRHWNLTALEEEFLADGRSRTAIRAHVLHLRRVFGLKAGEKTDTAKSRSNR